MRTHFVVLTVLFALLAGCATNPKKPVDRYVQDRFIIGAWVEPPADEKIVDRYLELARAGFNLVFGYFFSNTEPSVQQQLDACAKANMKAIVYLPGYIEGGVKGEEAKDAIAKADQFPEHPACMGYLLLDEPAGSQFPNVHYMVEHIRKTRPGKLPYVNLFPNYVPQWALGTPTYDEHVAKFVKDISFVGCVKRRRLCDEADAPSTQQVRPLPRKASSA